MITAIVIMWALAGCVAHIRQSNEMVTWCGTPVWEELGTYLAFFPAMIVGPLLFLDFERYDDRHPERK